LGPIKNLLSTSRHRSIWQTLAIYLAGSWFALEVVQGIVEAGNLPDWLPGMALVLLIIGFPVVLTTAFLQAGSGAQGTEVDGSAEAAEGPEIAGVAVQGVHGGGSGETAGGGPAAAHHFFTWRNAIVGGVAAFALWGVVAAVLLATGRAGGGTVTAEPLRASIAVLPFTSTRTDEESESFTLGMHDDLLTQLSKVGSLRVTSRTSVMEYRETTKNIREIGAELGVSTVLEGSIQRSGDMIHINAQLIDAETDAHLWADTYDRTLTVENVFHIQRELAEAIAEQLHATLTPEEAASIDAPPTNNLEAYDFYLQGNVYFARGPRSDDFEIALDMYRRATELDPGFALAYARMALTHGFLYQLQGREAEDIEASRAAAERALALDPDLPEGHLAMGEYLYWGPRDFPGAIREYDRAAAAGLNTFDLHHALGAVRRRLGDFEGSLASFQEAERLEPTSSHIHEDIGSTYQAVGRFAEAEDELRRAVAMAPNEGGSNWWLVNTLLARDGTTDRAWDFIRETEGNFENGLPFFHNYLTLFDRDFDTILERTEGSGFGQDLRLVALDAVGRTEEAVPIIQAAIERMEEELAENPGNADADLELASLYARAGEREKALAEVARVRALVEGDAMDGPGTTFSEVFVYTFMNDFDLAFDALERLYEGLPHDTPPRYVALFPHVDPMQADPRWDELQTRYAQPRQ
jgi:TolB-like protein/Tfp pilus assembly protein PilF